MNQKEKSFIRNSRFILFVILSYLALDWFGWKTQVIITLSIIVSILYSTKVT